MCIASSKPGSVLREPRKLASWPHLGPHASLLELCSVHSRTWDSMRGWYMLDKTSPCCPWRIIWITEMCRKWQSLLSLSLSLHIYTSHCDRAHVSNCISTFENVHHWQKMMSWSAFGCCDKTLTKDNLGKEMDAFGFYFSSVVSPSSTRARVGTQAGTRGKELEQRPWRAGGTSGCLRVHSQARIHFPLLHRAVPTAQGWKTTGNQEKASRDTTGQYDKDKPSTEVCSDWLRS